MDDTDIDSRPMAGNSPCGAGLYAQGKESAAVRTATDLDGRTNAAREARALGTADVSAGNPIHCCTALATNSGPLSERLPPLGARALPRIDNHATHGINPAALRRQHESHVRLSRPQLRFLSVSGGPTNHLQDYRFHGPAHS